MREKIFKFISRKVFKVPCGQIMPMPLVWLRYLLFPFRTYAAINSFLNYDIRSDYLTIGKEKVSVEALQKLFRGVSEGRKFLIYKEKSDYQLMIKEVKELNNDKEI